MLGGWSEGEIQVFVSCFPELLELVHITKPSVGNKRRRKKTPFAQENRYYYP